MYGHRECNFDGKLDSREGKVEGGWIVYDKLDPWQNDSLTEKGAFGNDYAF